MANQQDGSFAPWAPSADLLLDIRDCEAASRWVIGVIKSWEYKVVDDRIDSRSPILVDQTLAYIRSIMPPDISNSSDEPSSGSLAAWIADEMQNNRDFSAKWANKMFYYTLVDNTCSKQIVCSMLDWRGDSDIAGQGVSLR